MTLAELRARLQAGEVMRGPAGVRGDFPHGYGNPILRQLVERLSATVDPDAVDRLYREISDIFLAEVPVTCLYPRVEAVVAHRRIRGLSTPWRAHPLSHAATLSLDDRDSR